MTPSTLARLRSVYPSLTEGEQKVAATLLEAGDAIRDWPGRKLAERSGTTEPSVFRLARKLGFDGFAALRLALLEEHAVSRTRMELGIFNIPVRHDAPVPVQAQDVLRAYVDSLQQTATLLDPVRLERVAGLLRAASLATVVGMGSSLAIATLAENILLRCGIPCRVSQDAHTQLLQAVQHVEAHVVLGFSYSGETRETVEALEVARCCGATTVALTAFEHASIARHADVLLMVPVIQPQLYRVGLVDAVLPFLMLLDLLAVLITGVDTREAATLRDRVERAIRRRKLHEPQMPPAPLAAPDGTT